MAEERAHTELPGFTSQLKAARPLVTKEQHLTVLVLTLSFSNVVSLPGVIPPFFSRFCFSLLMRGSDLPGLYNKQLNCRRLSTATIPERTERIQLYE